MRLLYIIICSLVFHNIIQAKQISADQAIKVGVSFLQTESLNLEHVEKARFLPDTTTHVLFYIFNDQSNNAFVIVSGDDAAYPILGYSKESLFRIKDVGSNIDKWFEGYKKELRFIIQTKLPATTEIINEWNALLNGPTKSFLEGTVVNPLMKTKWNQSPFYNNLCPYDFNESKRSVTGCVATAMAQIMKYWNHPAKGVGSHTYVHSKYGTLSANYAITNYNWANMPNQLTSSNNDVATLMYHCGVSVDMGYSPSGSYAWVISESSPIENCSEYAFKNYFDYSQSSVGRQRSNYTESTWIQMLKDELDNQRPIMYEGHGSGGGHAFVCDGYDAGNFFHFNWGWGGVYDGYFKINSLNPGTGGTGGGSGTFNQYQKAIFNLSPNPKSSAPIMGLEFYSALTVNPSPILVSGDYTMSFNVVNKDAAPFKGDIIGVLIDEEYDIVNITTYYTETNGLPYDYHYTQARNFSGTLTDTVLPGNYYAVILAKPIGGTWEIVNDGNFSNFVQVTVTTENNIVMHKPFSITPSVITENKPVAVNFDVLNAGADFQGDFSLDLHSAEGVWLKTIGEFTNETLQNNYHYTNGLTFNSNNAFGVSAGTYQLVAWSKPAGGEWEMIKSKDQNYNPIKIIISKSELIADQFEENNSKVNATRIPYSSQQDYTYSTAYTSIHNTADIDYYKVDLPAGSSYFINARVQDEYASNNGKTYTMDVMWNYSLGNLTSDSYDDVNTDGSILVEGGQSIYFAVYPFFQGKTGTYDFELTISKSVPKDIYEDNNSSATSYQITESIPGITKNIKLVGASIHSSNDIDYYRLNCPAEFIYNVIPFIRDKNYLNNSNYSVDCEWSYSTNGSTWSSWMDGALIGSGSINMNGNSTLFIRVKAKNSGDIGSYGLEMDITKSMQKDNYESNDQVSISTTLYASFISNNAIVSTQNTSIHNPTDVDHYKIDLPAGYTYTIDNFLSDIISSNDGKSYSIDAKFAVSTNGTQWSSYYENINNGLQIVADAPKTVYIKVLPSKINTIGTYRYSGTITRKIISNVEEESFSPYSLTNERDGFTLRNAKNSIIHSVSVYSSDGKLYHENNNVGNELRINGLPSGVYHVYIKTNYGIAIEKVMSLQ